MAGGGIAIGSIMFQWKLWQKAGFRGDPAGTLARIENSRSRSGGRNGL